MKSNNRPPKLPLRFFRWYCHPKLMQYIEGDLMELYEERLKQFGKRKADLSFIVDVLLLFRPGIIRPRQHHERVNTVDMYRSYLKIGWRNVLRQKGYSLINISGLAVGMAVTILIGMWIFDELSFNKNHANYGRIAQVYQHRTIDNKINTEPAAPLPLAFELKTTYKSDFKHVVRAWWTGNHVLSLEEKKISQGGNFMDPEALELYSFEMVQGDWNSLRDPYSIVLSASASKAMFGDVDPVGKMIRIDNMVDAKVTGVYQEFPNNSTFHNMHFISTWELWATTHGWLKDDENNWNSQMNVFVEIQPNTTFEVVSAKIRDIKAKKINPEEAALENPLLQLQPMSRWHLYSLWDNGVEVGGKIQYVWWFGIIGAFVLLLACINFMNLSTAQSERRSKEVGIRKTIGSLRGQLIYQFLTESFLIVLFSFVVSIVLVTIALPGFNALASKEMKPLWTNGYFWAVSIAFVLITSLLAGSYPALYLSSIKPLKALKGVFKSGRMASLPRKILVVVQFTVSIMLIISTVVVWKQIQFAKDRPIGYDRKGLIMIRKTSPDFWGKFNVLRNELKATGAVLEVAESSSPATETWFNNTGITWEGKDPMRHDDFATMAVTHEYGKTMGWEFVQGRDYAKEHATDSSAVILNEAAVAFMGLDNPIDKEIVWDGKRYHVIGVIKDMIMDSPYQKAKQTIFWLNYQGNVWINIRLNPEQSAPEAVAKVRDVFQKIIPAVPFDFKFTDQEFDLKFKSEERIGKLASLFSVLAIFISCLGLFGMASFVAEQRKKEIGVRKVMGATVADVWKMLSTEFVVLVSISCFMGIPVAAYFLQKRLDKFAYRTELSWWVIAATVAGALFITLVTVSFQTIKAALANPVKSLRSE